MRMRRRHTKQAAFHEAGHAVARIYVGAAPTATEINVLGGGLSHGTGLIWNTPGGGQYAIWDFLIVLLAGPFAEARMRRQSKTWMLLSAGRDDYAEAQRQIMWLIKHRFTESTVTGWARAEEETRIFLRSSWPEITKVAALLLEAGRIEAAQLVEIAKPQRLYDKSATLDPALERA
jgi:hypothetical protein